MLIVHSIRFVLLFLFLSLATSDYIERSLQKAIDAVLTHMDTQDGLDLSMRQYITTIIASPVPVISYVAPTGVGELKFPRLKSSI